MPKLGISELTIIMVIVLIVFGVGKLPQIGGAVGKSLREFKKEKDNSSERAAKSEVLASRADAKEQARS